MGDKKDGKNSIGENSEFMFKIDEFENREIIINNYCDFDHTPERNKIQIKFLDSDYSKLVIDKIFDFEPENSWNNLIIVECEFEPINGGGVCVKFQHNENGIIESDSLIIEIRGKMGDDYPSVLRYAKRLRERGGGEVDNNVCVLISSYDGKGGGFESVKKVFEYCGIHLIQESEFLK